MSFVTFIRDMAEHARWCAMRVVSESLVALPFSTDEGTVGVFIRPRGRVQGKTEFRGPARKPGRCARPALTPR